MEKWKMIPKNGIDFNVSNQGNVQVINFKRKNSIRTVEEFSLSGGHPYDRYLSIYGDYVHRLVAEAWIGSIPEGYEVNHKDANKWNNKVSNLEIVTKSENIRHAFENGLNEGAYRKPKWFVLDGDEVVVTIYKDSDMALFLLYHGLVLEGKIIDTEKLLLKEKYELVRAI